MKKRDHFAAFSLPLFTKTICLKLKCACCVQHRRLLLDLFTSSYKVKRSAVQARLAQELGDVSKADVDRVLHVWRPLHCMNLSWCFVLCFSFCLDLLFFPLACCCRSAAAATRGCGTSRGRSSRDATPPPSPPLLPSSSSSAPCSSSSTSRVGRQ